MLKMKLAALILVMSATGCAMSGQEKTVAVDTACDWVVPIWLDRTEVDHMTDGTLRQILAHNETWKEKCNGGKMPDKKG